MRSSDNATKRSASAQRASFKLRPSRALRAFLKFRKATRAARRTGPQTDRSVLVISSDSEEDGRLGAAATDAFRSAAGYTLSRRDWSARVMRPGARLNDAVINAFVFSLCARFESRRWRARRARHAGKGPRLHAVALSTFALPAATQYAPLVVRDTAGQDLTPSAAACSDVLRLAVDLNRRATEVATACGRSSPGDRWDWSFADAIRTDIAMKYFARLAGRLSGAPTGDVTLAVLPLHLATIDHWAVAIGRFESLPSSPPCGRDDWVPRRARLTSVEVFDSLGACTPTDAQRVASWLRTMVSFTRLVEVDAVDTGTEVRLAPRSFQQINGSDCGLYSLIHTVLALRQARGVTYPDAGVTPPRWWPPTSPSALRFFRRVPLAQIILWGGAHAHAEEAAGQ